MSARPDVIDPNRAASALSALNPHCSRDEWFRILCAFAAAGGTEDVAEAWSRESPDQFDADNFRVTWRRAQTPGDVTEATLYRLARDAGWTPDAPFIPQPRPAPIHAPAQEYSTPEQVRELWEQCAEAIGHEYLSRKRIGAHGVRVSPAGLLIVPYINSDGEIQALQRIWPDGTKKFIKGHRAAGAVAVIGEARGAPVVVIAEGYATGATIHESTGLPVIVSGSVGQTARAIGIAKEWNPGARVIVAADHGAPFSRGATEGADVRYAGPEDAPNGYDFNDWRNDGASDDEIAARVTWKPREPVPVDVSITLPMNLIGLSNIEPQEPKFIMDGLPEGVASANFGHGGVGKSSIELTRAICIAAGIEFCGMPVNRRRVAFFSCEDRENVLHWRLSRICGALGVSMRSLDGWLNVFDLVGRDSAIYAPNARGDFIRAPFATVSQAIEDTESDVIFLDGTSDFFAGNENDRGQVKQFVNLSLGMMRDATGALMMIGHVGKEAARNPALRDSYSGSTQWHNAIRSRWNSAPEVAEDGTRTGRLIVSTEKANYSAGGVVTVWNWDEQHRAFVGSRDSGESGTVAFTIAVDAIKTALLECIAAVYLRGGYVPSAMQGRNTALSVLSEQNAYPDSLRRRGGESKARKALDELRRNGDVVEASFMRPNRHRTNVLITPDRTTTIGGLVQVIQAGINDSGN